MSDEDLDTTKEREQIKELSQVVALKQRMVQYQAENSTLTKERDILAAEVATLTTDLKTAREGLHMSETLVSRLEKEISTLPGPQLCPKILSPGVEFGD